MSCMVRLCGLKEERKSTSPTESPASELAQLPALSSAESAERRTPQTKSGLAAWRAWKSDHKRHTLSLQRRHSACTVTPPHTPINTDTIERVGLSQHSPLTTVAALTLFQFCSITKKWWHALYRPPERMILHAQRPH
jgi:hypothetical protein